MSETEIIQDNGTKAQLLEELKSNRLPVQMVLLDGDYNQITHVNGIRNRRGTMYFRTEFVQSFETELGGKKSWKSRFEFFGKDNIQYVFRARGWKIGRDGIWHEFPGIIERRQRRKYFRLELPRQTNLFLTVGSGQYKIAAIDISIGGIFGELVDFEGPAGSDPPWNVGDQVKDLVLEIGSHSKPDRIFVQEGILRRLDRELSDRTIKYAFEFVKMAKSEETALVDLVYELQRKILKERIKINA